MRAPYLFFEQNVLLSIFPPSHVPVCPPRGCFMLVGVTSIVEAPLFQPPPHACCPAVTGRLPGLRQSVRPWEARSVGQSLSCLLQKL